MCAGCEVSVSMKEEFRLLDSCGHCEECIENPEVSLSIIRGFRKIFKRAQYLVVNQPREETRSKKTRKF